MTITLILFYFGSFPAYFPLFLRSCSVNPGITWRVYTDNPAPESLPDNVLWQQLTFEQCLQWIQSRFDFPICLDSPKKLCDLRPLYGYLLEGELQGVAYWGHCDADMIWGDLQGYLEQRQLTRFDKVFSLGHLTLYRNTPQVNRWLLEDLAGQQRCRQVLGQPRMCSFDEWGLSGINELMEQAGFACDHEPCGADVWPERTRFSLSQYDRQTGRYRAVDDHGGAFQIRDGRLYRVWRQGEEIVSQEFPWVHLQKREFTVDPRCMEGDYWILPHRMAVMDQEEALTLAARRPLWDRQWVRIKWFNLRYRIRRFCERVSE